MVFWVTLDDNGIVLEEEVVEILSHETGESDQGLR